MGLLSSLFSRSQSSGDAAAAESESGDSVARARRRARQRLVGAVVLVGIGIIGFPLLFETAPRPIAVDVPIEIPSREGAAPLVLPESRESKPDSASARPAAETGKPETMITETASEAGKPVTREQAEASADKPTSEAGEKAAEAKPAQNKPETKAEAKAETKAEIKPAAPAPTPAPTPADRSEAARARALLEGKVSPKESAAETRYIVQIGAFADPALARATRLKVEKLGLVTYTHVAKTANGDRTRVRVGPVASREEAEKIAAKIKAAGLPTAILTL